MCTSTVDILVCGMTVDLGRDANFGTNLPDLSYFTRLFRQFPFMVHADNSMDPWLVVTGESRVSVVEAELQLEVEDLARTKWMTGTGLPSCNPQSWIEWLAYDVVHALRVGAG